MFSVFLSYCPCSDDGGGITNQMYLLYLYCMVLTLMLIMIDYNRIDVTNLRCSLYLYHFYSDDKGDVRMTHILCSLYMYYLVLFMMTVLSMGRQICIVLFSFIVSSLL